MGTSYAQAADFAARFPVVYAKATAASVNVQLLLDDSSANADGYLGSHFVLPLTAWGQDLRGKVCQLAAYDVMAQTIGFKPGPGTQDENYQQIRDVATRWLEGVSQGRIPISVTDSSPGGIQDGPLALSDESRLIELPPRNIGCGGGY